MKNIGIKMTLFIREYDLAMIILARCHHRIHNLSKLITKKLFVDIKREEITIYE